MAQGIDRRRFIAAGAAAAAIGTGAASAASVSLQTPLLAGSKLLAPSAGAPVAMMLFYPTDDLAVQPVGFGTAPRPARPPAILAGSKLPLVIFLHGQDTTYQSWTLLPATLARAGFFVVVPDIDPSEGAIAAKLPLVLDFLQHRSEIAALLDGRIAVSGHSLGGAAAMQWAADHGAAAFAGLSGQYAGYGSDVLPPYAKVRCPTLIVWGDGEDASIFPQWNLASDAIKGSQWDPLPQPKHLLTVVGGGHFDYVPPDAPGLNQGGLHRGPCASTPAVVADVVAAFFAKYLQPSGATISNSLIPPLPQAPPASSLFSACFVPEVGVLTVPAAAGAHCQFAMHWQTGSLVQGAGDVRFSVAEPGVGLALVQHGVTRIGASKATVAVTASPTALANPRITWQPSQPGMSVTLLDANGRSALLTYDPVPGPLAIGTVLGAVTLVAKGDCGRMATTTQSIVLTPAALNLPPPKGSGSAQPLRPL